MVCTLELEFISKFHTLNGITLKERYKNLYNLLVETGRLLEVDGKINLSALHPKTSLEEHFKIQALIHFKCVHDLFSVLRSENPAHINQVLKHRWILEVLEDITPEYLATHIFPSLSYCAKQKLLTKLSSYLEDTHKADRYFEVIKESYGLYIASQMLPSCSYDLIIRCIELHKTRLRANQLLTILKKWPAKTEAILEKLNQQNTKLAVGKKYQIVFKYLAKNDAGLFLKLFYKYSPNIQLGAKETDVFIKNCKNQKAFGNIKICKILNNKQIARSLGSDFKGFYYNIFPKCINDLKNNLESTLEILIGLVSDSVKLNMFSTTFKQIYGNEIWEHSDFMIPKLIEWMFPDDRETFLTNHIRPADIWEGTWISYHKSDKSVPMLIEKITLVSSIEGRTKYIVALLKTCKINKDSEALLNVLKYINNKHRNDNTKLLQEVLLSLNNSFDDNLFTEEHWVEIKLFIQFYVLNNINNRHCSLCRNLLAKYIMYRLSHKLPVKEDFDKWIKDYPDEYNTYQKNPKFQKMWLLEFEAVIPLENVMSYVMYLRHVILYNQRNPRNKLILNIRDQCLKCVKQCLENKNNAMYTHAAQIVGSVLIMQDSIEADEAGLLKCFLDEKYYGEYHIRVIIYLINTNPTILLKYFNFILHADGRQNDIKKFLKNYCTMYTHLGIPQTIIKLCHDAIEGDDINTFRSSVVALSIVSTPQEFLLFSSSYYPSESSVDIMSDSKQMLYKKQQVIANAIANLIPISHAIEGILQFCKGDYLKFVERGLVRTLVHTVENKLPPLFDVLKKHAVSVRKYAVFFSFKILNISQALNILLEFMQKEKNVSVLTVIFKTAFCMFLQNPNNNSWKLVTQGANLVNLSSEKEVFSILTNYQRIPLHYFDECVRFAWSVVCKCVTDNNTVEDEKIRVLQLVTPTNISALSKEFCKEIIGRNLFKCEQLTNFQKAVQSFTCTYLIYDGENEVERLQYICNLLKEFQAKNSNNIAVMALKFKLIYNFVKQLCNDIMISKCTENAVFEQFLNMWEQTIQPYEACDEFIHLRLTSIYLNASYKQLNIVQIGAEIASLCEFIFNQNGIDIPVFAVYLQEYLKHFYILEHIGYSDENQMLLIESIVNNRSSYICLELTLSLLPNSGSLMSPIIKQRYNHVINVILKEPNHLLQVSFKHYLKKVSEDLKM